MALRLNGQTTGYTELNAPDNGDSVVLTMPGTDGNAGEYLQTNGSGTLSWAGVTIPTVAFDAYAVICDQKAGTSAGGTFTAGSHIQRDLNTELFDPDGIVTIASNEFTVPAGNYLIVWKAPAFGVARHTSRLRDVTGSMTSVEGTTSYCHASYGNQTDSWGWARVTPTASNTYQIRHRCETTNNGNGLGVDSSSASDSKFTVVWIFREA